MSYKKQNHLQKYLPSLDTNMFHDVQNKLSKEKQILACAWKKANKIKLESSTIYLKSFAEYHECNDLYHLDNKLIKFDCLEKCEEMIEIENDHNNYVYKKNNKKEPFFAPDTYLYLKDYLQNKHDKFSIEIEVDGFLLDKMECEWLEIGKLLFDIKPYISEDNVLDMDYVYFMNTHGFETVTLSKKDKENHNNKIQIPVFKASY